MYAEFYFDDVKIGTTQTLENVQFKVEREYEYLKQGELKLLGFESGRTITADIKGANLNQDYFSELNKYPIVDLVVIGYKTPQNRKLPKNKRIRKKWMKKYRAEIRLDNCKIL